MTSYFDLPPQQSKSAATAEVVGLPKDDETFGRMSLLSPQVTRILDDLDLEGHSSSDDDDSLSGNSRSSDQDGVPKEKDRQQSAQKDTGGHPSPKEEQKHTRLAPPRSGVGRPKQPHFARFHSLRSMLFSSRIEADIQKSNEVREQEEAEAKWKAEYESRKGLNRPKTPERPSSSGSNSPTKEGFRHRIGNRIKRMTSKEVPTMAQLPEDSVPEINDNESTASSDNDDEGDAAGRKSPQKHRDADEESINHSDVEDLVRWVSRRDPPSDGEVRKGKSNEDPDHESVGDSDVDDLVRWVSRRPAQETNPVPEKKPEAEKRVSIERIGYSDASTVSDSEGESGKRSSPGDEDGDELSRWISRRDGPKAGPVRQNHHETPAPVRRAVSSPSGSESEDSNPPELARWITRHDDTSGESDVAASGQATPLRKDEASQSDSTRPEYRSTLTHDDINDLVRWVSRKEPKAEAAEPPKHDRLLEIQQDEDEKKEKLGMKADMGSLSHSDVNDLLDFVKSRDQSAPQVAEGKEDIETKNIEAKEQEKKEQLGMNVKGDMGGSLSHGDVNELVEWVSRKK